MPVLNIWALMRGITSLARQFVIMPAIVACVRESAANGSPGGKMQAPGLHVVA